jgi:hypothetical protein
MNSDNWRGTLLLFAPAFVTFIGLSVILCLVYGAAPVARTIIPAAGLKAYRTSSFGDFAVGFWWRPDLGWPYYISTAAGFFVAGTFWLSVRAARLIRALMSDHAAQLIITCAALHLVFFSLMFGNRASWVYYPYILVIGLALTTLYASAWNRFAIPGLTVLALCSQTNAIYAHAVQSVYVQSYETRGLKAEPQERQEWRRALELAEGHRAVILAEEGDAALLFPVFEKPVALFIVPGLTLPSEAARAAQQLQESDIVVTTAGLRTDLSKIPNILTPLSSFRQVLAGRYLDVYTRDREQR